MIATTSLIAVQQEIHGHRGRKNDPAPSGPEHPAAGEENLADRQNGRLDAVWARR